MEPNHDGDPGAASLATALRREARNDEPCYSEVFHARLIERIAYEAGSAWRDEEQVSRATPRSKERRPLMVAIAAGALVVVVAVVAVSVARRATESRDRIDVAAAVTAPRAIEDVRHDDEPLGRIETLPLYDDFEAGIRDGMWTLTASMVELPDWANLADFDAAAFTTVEAGP